MAEPKKLGSFVMIAAIAAGAVLAGGIAGAIALYVNDARSGNPLMAGAGQEAAECSAAAPLAREIGDAAIGEVAALRAADEPLSLATLEFEGPDGRPMKLGDIKNKVLLVNLWATWCVPCREEMKALDRLQAEKGGDDFQVVAINIDTGDDEKPAKFLEEVGIENLVYYHDSTFGVFNSLKSKGLAFGLPVTLFTDGESCLLAAMNGPADWASADAMRLVDRAVAASGS